MSNRLYSGRNRQRRETQTTNDTTMALGIGIAITAMAVGIGIFAANYRLGLAVNEPDAPMMETRWTLDGCETVCRPVVAKDMGRK